ncbi:TPA: hypothetical protein N0F65_003211 [Lagenidium giganteum]|uniref:Metalloendopeptidase n=1 Tax=Lagenidium giganteum TaxID=4803 RepID=A0AAV2Z7R8_9STRA|nr:TPA: hypothetical protein N0F65_003211 [Lagenidium giganteum]
MTVAAIATHSNTRIHLHVKAKRASSDSTDSSDSSDSSDTVAPTPAPSKSHELKGCNINGVEMRHHSLHYYSEKAYVACANGTGGCYLADKDHDHARQVPCPTNDFPGKIKAETKRRHEIKERYKEHGDRRLSLAVANEQRTWDDGVVCYDFNKELPFNSTQRGLIAEAMRVYESTTNVRFLPVKTCKDNKMKHCGSCDTFVDFSHPPTGRDCNSSIGVNGDGAQVMNLADRCFEADNDLKAAFGTAMHEIGHSLGLYHEHQHPNREIAVFWDDLPQSLWAEMKVRDVSVGGKYDYNSVMHYPDAYDFCYPKICADGKTGDDCVAKGTKFCGLNDDKKSCVTPNKSMCEKARTSEIGQRRVLSAGDLEALNALYTKAPWKSTESKIKA